MGIFTKKSKTVSIEEALTPPDEGLYQEEMKDAARKTKKVKKVKKSDRKRFFRRFFQMSGGVLKTTSYEESDTKFSHVQKHQKDLAATFLREGKRAPENKKIIVDALVLLMESNEISTLDVIKFDLTESLSKDIEEKLYSMLDIGYLNVGTKVAQSKGLKVDLKKGNEFKNRVRLRKLGKKLLNPPWYKRIFRRKTKS